MPPTTVRQLDPLSAPIAPVARPGTAAEVFRFIAGRPPLVTPPIRELTTNLLFELGKVSAPPGAVEHARWAKLQSTNVKVSVEWEVPDQAGALELVRCLNAAVSRWLHRVQVRQLQSLTGSSLSEQLNRAKQLESGGHTDAALDLVYDSIDELFRRGQFALCDAYLSEIDVSKYSTDILLAVLTATSPARSRLSTRDNLVARVRDIVETRGELEEGLFVGL